MGKSYPVRILVKNDGPRPKKLNFVIHSPGRFIYPDYDSEIFAIGARNTYLTQFEVTPIRPHIGVVNITAYLIEGESPDYLPTEFKMLDTVTVYVTRIDPLLSRDQKALLIIALVLVSMAAAYLLYRYLRQETSPWPYEFYSIPFFAPTLPTVIISFGASVEKSAVLTG